MRLRNVVLLAGWLASGAAPASAATLSGTVTDERGQPIAGVDLDFVLVATGEEVVPFCASESCRVGFSCGDDTDALGTYCATVPGGIYEVRYMPLPGARLASHAESNVNLTTSQALDVTLRDAWFVSGAVLRSDTGGPAAGVDLDFRDLRTRQKIFTSLDDTDASGRYIIAVPIGIYEVSFDGPGVSDLPRLAPARLQEISVTGARDFSLPTVTMHPGFQVEGELLDEKGDGVPGGDLDFFPAGTNDRIFTSRDNTDASGFFLTVVPPGSYDVLFKPPLGSLSVTWQRSGIEIGKDLSLGSVMLPDGWLVSGAVRDPDGFPVRAVDLDFRASSNGVEEPTTWDETDAAGVYRVRVPTGTYDIEFNPRLNSLLLRLVRADIPVAFDRALSETVLPFRDRDSDGSADVHDNCPLVENDQEDADGDSVGDACDDCPSEADFRQEDNDADGPGDACDADDDNDGLPDTGDPDADGDGFPNEADNCPQAANAGQLDRDADGSGDACDPDDGEVEVLSVVSSSRFVWRPEIQPTGYLVYRQNLPWLSRINFGVCFQEGLRAPTFHDSDLPEPGTGFAYLVTARVAAGEGSLGRGSNAAERPNLRPCPYR